jgi:hypothetical protein
MYKEIKKTELLDMSAGQLSLYSTITGAVIGEGHTPLTGRYITIDGTRQMERVPKDGLFAIDYEQYDTGQIIRIRIGTEYHGPLLGWDDGYGWRNLYSQGNYGKNYASGGRWSAGRGRGS